MRIIENIVIHCSDTPAGRDIGADEIRKWHTEERGWSDIGYHYVVRLDGKIEYGRMVNVIGAHVKGFNTTSIGICYVGGMDNVDTRTPEQKSAIWDLVKALKHLHPGALVSGHRDFAGVDKYCPSFDALREYN